MARKGGEGTAYVTRQLESMREPLRKYLRRVTNIEKFGAAKQARKNGKLGRDPDGGPLSGGPYVDNRIRGSKISVNQTIERPKKVSGTVYLSFGRVKV